jgi:hypothetical protein
LLVELYWHPWLKFLSTGKWCLQCVKSRSSLQAIWCIWF